MQNVKSRGHGIGVKEAGADVLFGAGKAGIERVQIHIDVVDHIAAHHRALVEVDVIQIINQARRVIQVLRGGIAVIQRDRVNDMHSSPCCAEMHIAA